MEFQDVTLSTLLESTEVERHGLQSMRRCKVTPLTKKSYFNRLNEATHSYSFQKKKIGLKTRTKRMSSLGESVLDSEPTEKQKSSVIANGNVGHVFIDFPRSPFITLP